MPADWMEITIPEGETHSEVINIPYDSISVPPGQISDEDGNRMVGRSRPRFDVEDLGPEGVRIVLDDPAPKSLVFRVKGEEEDDGA